MPSTPQNFYQKLLGRVGEKKAAEYLKKKGYKIIKTNYKTAIGEIDIIAEDGEYLVFIEVKTRSTADFGQPSQAVNLKKQEKYYKVALQYLQREKKTHHRQKTMIL